MPECKIPCPQCGGPMASRSKTCITCRVSRGAGIDLAGQRFDLLVVTGPSQQRRIGRGEPSWLCQCDCGKTADIKGTDLRNGRSGSCGCRATKNRLTHGESRTPEYKAWLHMHARCNDPNDRAWHNYGGRGIAVCERWASVENFIADMGRRPVGTSIDRIDNDGPYSPENCRWATKSAQGKNTRRTRMLTHDGETLPMIEWSARLGMGSGTLHARLKAGWPVALALTTPLGARRGTNH